MKAASRRVEPPPANRRSLGWLALVLLLSLPLVSCARRDDGAAQRTRSSPEEPLPNIVLISVDTLRRDHLGCYGYSRDTSPHIDRLAAEGALFESAISSASWTLPAHAALFTGLSDTVHGALDTDTALAEDRTTLAERLKAAGYTTVGFFSGPTLYPAFGLGQGFDTYVDCTSYPELSAESARTPGIEIGGPLQTASMSDVTGLRIEAAVRAWLNDSRQQPFLMFIHMWDVHFDFIPPPPYDRKFDPDYDGPATGRNFIFDPAVNAGMPARDLQHIIALYDGEIAWTDAHIGRILDQLDSLELRDSTIVVLLADHGEEFFEHGNKGHRQTLFDEVIRIPLIMRYPGHVPAGRRYTEQVRMIDILPTLVDLLGLPAPDDTMGQSLTPLFSGQTLTQDSLAVSELFSLGRALRSFRRPDRKAILHTTRGGALMFDLSVDPQERNPLPNADSDVGRAMLDDMRAATASLAAFRQRLRTDAAAPALPDKVRKRLESLGYLEGDAEDAAGQTSQQPTAP